MSVIHVRSPTFQGLLIKKIIPLTLMGVMDDLKKSKKYAEQNYTDLLFDHPSPYPMHSKKCFLQNFLTTFMLKK